MYSSLDLALHSYNIFIDKLLFHADEEKKMNASYIISIARKLGCSIFLLPEDITEVIWKNQYCLIAPTLSFIIQRCLFLRY